MRITIIGGGVIGLCSAYYLRKQGYEVTVIDRNTITDGCSFGNMGYISPSHFVPLATPGIIRQGLKWMLRSDSPFYIKPRFNMDLIKWGLLFNKNAKSSIVEANAPHLNNLLQLSRELMLDIKRELPESFDMMEKGCMMLYKNLKTGEHEKILAEQAEKFGLKTIICNPSEAQEYEPEVELNVAGGVLYVDDCHLNPTKFMNVLYTHLQKQGVKFWLNTEVTAFTIAEGRVKEIITDKGDMSCDELIVSNGSWMNEIGKKLSLNIPMQPGKGYSIVYENLKKNLQYPSILVDHRTATTPINRWLRIGGTMEMSGHSNKILPKRVKAIYNAFKEYYPKMEITNPDPSKAWYGYRPVTPDGLPYIGRHEKYYNLSFAGGHAMLGVSAAAATGKLMEEIISWKKPDIDINAFRVQRFEN